jgi:hypothetical protein
MRMPLLLAMFLTAGSLLDTHADSKCNSFLCIVR